MAGGTDSLAGVMCGAAAPDAATTPPGGSSLQRRKPVGAAKTRPGA
jgi:hypothetical protein